MQRGWWLEGLCFRAGVAPFAAVRRRFEDRWERHQTSRKRPLPSAAIPRWPGWCHVPLYVSWYLEPESSVQVMGLSFPACWRRGSSRGKSWVAGRLLWWGRGGDGRTEKRPYGGRLPAVKTRRTRDNADYFGLGLGDSGREWTGMGPATSAVCAPRFC